MKIQLDKERELQFDANMIADAEASSGLSLTEMTSNPSVRGIRALLWAGLKTEDPDLTIERAGGLMRGQSLADLSKALGKALADFFVKSS